MRYAVYGHGTATSTKAIFEIFAAAFFPKEQSLNAFDSTWRPVILAALVRRKCSVYLMRVIASYLSGGGG